VTNNIFNQSAFNLSDEEFGLIVYADEDGSCTQDNPILNTGDIVYLTVNATSCFEGIFTDTLVCGMILPEVGPYETYSITTPEIWTETIVDLL